MLCLFFSCSADVVCLGAHSFIQSFVLAVFNNVVFHTAVANVVIYQFFFFFFLLPLRCAKRLIDCCWWSAQQFSDCIVLKVRRLTAAGLTDNRSATFLFVLFGKHSTLEYVWGNSKRKWGQHCINKHLCYQTCETIICFIQFVNRIPFLKVHVVSDILGM